jgi:putative Ca2+/H+ antiporter (TMEM165/GDT1 family)
MIDFLTALGVAFGVIFVAELGDKSQLLALNFGARYPLRTVVVGLTVGYAAAGVIATVVGGLLGAAFPERPVEIVGGVVFLVFAALALRDDNHGDSDGDDDAVKVKVSVTRSVVVTIAVTIAVAEMGDKTQIATATLAAQAHPVATWIGATAGAVCSGMVGAVAGMALGDRVRPGVLRWISAVLFAGFGMVMLLGIL